MVLPTLSPTLFPKKKPISHTFSYYKCGDFNIYINYNNYSILNNEC